MPGTVSADPGRFNLLKAELYWSLRERFEAGEISGLDDALAVSQLASIRYKHDLRGRVVIESKEDAKKRGVSSPDRAESLMLCFADQTPVVLDWIREQVEGAQAYDDRPVISRRAPLPTQPVEEDAVEGNQLIDEYYRVQNEIRAREDEQHQKIKNPACPVTSNSGWTSPGVSTRAVLHLKPDWRGVDRSGRSGRRIRSGSVAEKPKCQNRPFSPVKKRHREFEFNSGEPTKRWVDEVFRRLLATSLFRTS
jgi:hypothetical protein